MQLIKRLISGTLALLIVGTLAAGLMGCQTAGDGGKVQHKHGTGSKEHKTVTQ